MKVAVVMNSKAGALEGGSPDETAREIEQLFTAAGAEAKVVLAELRRRNVRSFLLVTSDFHTARAGRIYRAALRAAGGGPAMRVASAADEFFRPDSWWRTRQAQKIFFVEWCKTIASAIGV